LPENDAENNVLTTAEASAAILGEITEFDIAAVLLDDAVGCTLRQSVYAERDQPPFDRVMMDGIAISFADFDSGKHSYPIQSMQSAGDPAQTLQQGKCIEIMTGASLPANADCIIPVERVRVTGDTAELEDDYQPKQNQFVHPRGSDHAAGTELLMPGQQISALDIAVIASCGFAEVSVSENPRVAVISTGNELVAAGEPIEAHQIRLSNGPAIAAMLCDHGYNNCVQDHIVDDKDTLKQRIATHLADSKVLILSGGVSMGKADYVPQVLSELGVRMVFHKISQRPGKPMWFGIGPNDQVVFALPGNPVSTLVCCRQYVIPALKSASGITATRHTFANLATEVTFEPELTCFMPVKLASAIDGKQLALPIHSNTSGDFASLSGTDGYVELDIDTSKFPAGTGVPLHRW
jgi:molybdopterin molybdotransferase